MEHAVVLDGVGAPAGTVPDALGPVLGPLDDVLDPFLDGKAAAHATIDARLAALTDAVASLVRAGGKRLRPAFVYWGHRAAGAGHDDAVLHVAAAIEVVHAFALLHDDVMDRSARRRGRPAAHVTLQAHHRATGLVGDSEWFGISAAILAGDLAHVWADELLESAPVGSAAATRARAVFAALRDEVVAGQYLDLLLAGDPDADEAASLEVALLKSARYSVTRPLELGAALAGADRLPALRAYGDPIGIAFQLRDDVLGLFGDPSGTGKGNLDDLREGKRTVLVLEAMRLADECGRRVLHRALGDPTLDQERAEDARAVVARSGALASVEARIRAEHQQALQAVDGLPRPARDALVALAERAVVRDR